jgi:phosphatidate cytidylyltransferase
MSGTDARLPRGGSLSNLQLRVLSGFVLGLIAVAETWAGGIWFELFCVVIGVAIFIEWCVMTRERSDRRHQLASAALFAIVLVVIFSQTAPPVAAVAAGGMACVLAGIPFARWQWTAAGFVYAAFSAAALAEVRGDGLGGLYAIVLLFAVVWTSDIMAYFVGRRFGGPKLAPAISPGKTWSGAVGGAFFGSLAGMTAAWAFGANDLARVVAVSLILSVISQAGDLFESWVKRRHGVKDSSRVIPGHGGVMDRVDGLVAAAAALYLMVLIGGGDAAAWLFQGAGSGGL